MQFANQIANQAICLQLFAGILQFANQIANQAIDLQLIAGILQFANQIANQAIDLQFIAIYRCFFFWFLMSTQLARCL